MLGAGVQGFARNDQGRSVVALADGNSLECDAVVLGVGLVPNDELAREAGLECDGGVVVDSQCRSSDPDILAAGDVAVAPNLWAGRRLRLESWQNAQDQGIAAARSALGLEVDYQPLPWFWSDQYGMNLQIYGVPMPSHRVVVRGAPGSDSFVLFYLDGDVVKAALGPNAAKDLRFARRLIERRLPVDPNRLTDVDTPMSKV
jgi:3-phenylpropionate/trans-cinnamate dioxygenase ferredoxin reductase subunit